MKARFPLFLLLILSAVPLFSQTFTNIAPQANVNASYYVHNYIPGGGVAIGDINNDGYPDVIIATADTALNSGRIKVYRNNGGTSFTDITASSGIDFQGSGLKSVIMGDFNNDGWRDVYITSWYTGCRLYKNNGNGTFTDVTSTSGVGIGMNVQSTAASWIDINNDGYLDLYVCNYGGIEGYGNQFNNLFRNNGNGTFTDITTSAGVADSLMKKPLSILCFDYNNDGWQDILITNDKQQRPTLYKNNGNSTFTDVTISCGLLCFNDGMGAAISDIYHDGNMGVYLSNGVQGNRLFKNNGNGTFTNITSLAGIAMNKNCWGASFLDYDNDGYDDLFITASLGIDMCDGFFKSQHNGQFVDRVLQAGLVDSLQSHCSAIGDLNNDGYPDLVVTEVDTTARVYKNNGFSNTWIKFKCTGTVSNRDAIGTTVTVYYNGTMCKKAITAGCSYMSCDDVVLMFGLGQAQSIDSAVFHWTNGMIETAHNLAANNIYYAQEGSGIIGIRNISTEVPRSYELLQNYPNPFNPSTTINFALPVSGNIRLAVYDINGRITAVIADGFYKAGTYSADFDASRLASGIYFYRLISGSFSETKKMVLTK